MGKRGGKSYQKKDVKDATTTSRRDRHVFTAEDMDDDIDAFHKQRDIVPLDINADSGESDEDDEIPIFESKDIDNEETDEDEEEDDDGKSFMSKLIRQKKFLDTELGGDEDVSQDDDDEDDGGLKSTTGGRKYKHGAENLNFEQQASDDEDAKEEEKIALQMQRKKTTFFTEEEFELAGISEDKHAKDKGNREIKSLDSNATFKVEDLSALSKEEQMNVLYRSAPELVDWLSELNEAHKQLECKIKPFLSKVKNGGIITEGGVRYFELKELLLLSYCQAITFYLLLKSEGQPVDDHPVMARLEEIKELMNQIKQLDEELPVELEDILKGSSALETVVKSDNKDAPMQADSITKNQEQPLVSVRSTEAVSSNIVEMKKSDASKDSVQKGKKVKNQKDHIGAQSLEMLKIRASLEEKLRQKGLYSQIAPNPSNSLKRSRPANGQLATYDDFDDDAVGVNGPAGMSNGLVSSKVSPFVSANLKKLKVASGDDDLPKRDVFGERRRKHEVRVMAGAGVKTEDDNGDDQMDNLESHEVDDEEEDSESGGDSENELYNQAERLQALKRASKTATYSSNSSKSAVSSLAEDTVDGKRYITSQMSKNRGLTRSRNKNKKNPRKNYKLKHQKALRNRKGQVQAIRSQSAPYGGESTGINAAISRSVRFKN
ncbi:something about silencing protein 10 isoform X1 [Trifolium pratense]|uniref:something about silencing protein 10 isoform X1 n=1 Tax=Trifolium pratense TaxID=57577 RepID=UPI0008431EF4|nr:something about silencing protein 10 isoform X1 [Trifolium pratense]